MKILGFLFLCLLLMGGFKQSIQIIQKKPNENLSVYVTGEIRSPKKVTLPIGSLIKDVIKYVELTENAEVNLLDLNKILVNEMIVNIPEKKKCISINHSPYEDLITIDGIGNKTAELIIEYRNKSTFLFIEELKMIKGIGEKKFEKISKQVCL